MDNNRERLNLDLLDEIFGVFTAFTLFEFTSQIFSTETVFASTGSSLAAFLDVLFAETAPIVFGPIILILSAIWFRECTENVRPLFEKLSDEAFHKKGNFKSNLRALAKPITHLILIGIVTFLIVFFLWFAAIDASGLANQNELKVSVQIAMFGTLLWSLLRVLAFTIIPNLVPKFRS